MVCSLAASTAIVCCQGSCHFQGFVLIRTPLSAEGGTVVDVLFGGSNKKGSIALQRIWAAMLAE
jgi:hypothetical protein